jgi:hypothetical protein
MLAKGNYHPVFGRVPITDTMIEEAQPFEGWNLDFLSWPKHLWNDSANGVPCEDPNKNAYHIKYLADCMLKAGRWVGDKLTLYKDGSVYDGSHRLRAAQYLKSKGIDIQIPVRYTDLSR